MKLISSRAELLPWLSGLEGVYKTIEVAGRTCYKSEEKITDDSAKGFVDRMVASKHTAMLEHGTVYLQLPDTEDFVFYHENPYSKLRLCPDGSFAVTTNYRVLVENNKLEDLKYICDPMEYHEMRYSFKFTTDRGVSHELVRHRVFSFAQESTRYCNYSKDKFGNELTFIRPSWSSLPFGEFKALLPAKDLPNGAVAYNDNRFAEASDCDQDIIFVRTCLQAEGSYKALLDKGCTPQEARQVLPNALKTEIVMTGFASDWRFFFDLRLFGKTGAPHPDMKALAERAYIEASKQGILGDIESHPSKFDNNE